MLYERLKGGRVRCKACARLCSMNVSQTGFCGVRRNVDGRLMLLAYGRLVTAHVDPIEKKPLVHYMPGSKVFSIATTGCNWACLYCQNYDISQRRRVEGFEAEPSRVVNLALEYGCEGIAYTYNEPLIALEFYRDIGVLARSKGIFNVFVSNGYTTPEGVAMLSEFLDGITVDFKGSGEPKFLRRFAAVPDLEPVYETLVGLKKAGVHVEITDLVVPEIGDSLEAARNLCRWLVDNLGPDVPVHFLRFYPAYKVQNLPPTPIETLEKHYRVGKEAGLKYVYLGNVPGHPYEHTYCPGCGAVAVERFGFDILAWNLDKDNRCLRCGYRLPIIGRLSKAVSEERFRPVFW